MRAFKCLLRGFRDLEDGSTTAKLDIPKDHIPDNPKQFRQEWGYFILESELKNLTEGNTGNLDRIQVYDAMISLLETWMVELEEKKREV